MLFPLVKLLLPPILEILGNLVGAIGRLIWFFEGQKRDNSGKEIGFGATLINVGDSIKNAANMVKSLPDDLISKAFAAKSEDTSSTTQTVKDTTQSENAPVILQATGTGIRVMPTRHELQVEADNKKAEADRKQQLEEARKSRVAQEGILTLSQIEAMAKAKESADKKVSIIASGIKGAKTTLTAEEVKAYGIIVDHDNVHGYSFRGRGLPLKVSKNMNASGELELEHL
jgi:hypothetical protein